MTEVRKWIAVAATKDINPDTSTLRVVVNDEPVCLYKLSDGGIYATHDTCTHGDASLADGYIENDVIECPLHQGCFDIRTGQAVRAPCRVPIRIYPVKVERGVIYLEGP
ncbi:Rieske 2Fe-2S domain-containing protein [Bordetella petrii]|nr:Rieske 2Fe-2S domain-containing protein [Bordetella petrii]